MDIALVLKIAAIGLIVAILHQILTRAGREDYALLTALAGIVVVLMMLIPLLTELLGSVDSVFRF